MIPENDPKKPSPARVGIWIVVGAIGAWMLVSGVVGGLLANGG